MQSTKIRKQVICNRISEPTKSSKPPTVINHNRRSDGPEFVVTSVHQKTSNKVESADEKFNRFSQLTSRSSQENKKYSKPELHSTLTVAKKLEDLKLPSTKRIDSVGDLTPRTKTQVTKQVSD